ncbi:efflux RND transporter periplasmic adaptor subunit [Viridibacterium curvum]|uniref:Efflux RND transporter periplasmic adaptor subunit n=1 Tax=Viridibacterium curvum TaxID=1101404 RepID=A0ABP9QBV4_9RHOO
MKRPVALSLGALALAATLALGYGLGRRAPTPTGAEAMPASAALSGERKILYYRNPMGLPDTSPVPKKDQMGMDYIPVYAGEEPEANDSSLKISTAKVQKLGVRSEAASLRVLDRIIRAAGRVEADERRTYAIAPRFEGYVERLHVNASGQTVSRGQLLFEAYSPELVSAQREYAIAMQGLEALKGSNEETQRSMRQLAEGSLTRLRNWEIPEAEIKALGSSQEARRTLPFRSPVTGIVSEKKALQGMRFMPGETLYQITDLSSVWVIADVFEQDIALVKIGSKASVRLAAQPGKAFEGRITYIYPTLNEATRTIPIRVELANPQGLLKPAMYAQIELSSGASKPVLSVPDSAVIDSGTRTTVLVQTGEGRFEPREVKLGARSDHYVSVLQGLREGELVVVAANFLLDAESNLRAALGGFGSASTPAATPASGVHKATGKVDSLDAGMQSAMLTHEPVPSLKWPAMTMEFQFANPSLATGLKAGQAVDFEFVERKPGDWVITRISKAKP